jgi:predicted GNAT family acetyltransferase
MAVTHDSDNSRYVFTDDEGLVAGEMTYLHDNGVLLLTKAEIWPERRGEGLGIPLVRQTLEMIEAEGHGPIRAVCPFVAKFLMKNTEFQHLTA